MPAIMPLPVVGSTGTPLRLDVSMCSPEMTDWPAVELPLGAPDLICSAAVPPAAMPLIDSLHAHLCRHALCLRF